MSVGYILVNHTKEERVLFAHIPASTKRELAGCPVSAAITTWYLLEHPGDTIAFVSDTYGEWPFASGSHRDLSRYTEVTDAVVASLIEAGILQDDGREVVDDNEPDSYVRKLRNVWWQD